MENELVVDERGKWVRRYAMGLDVIGILVILTSVIFSFLLILGLAIPIRDQVQALRSASYGIQILNGVISGVAVLALAQLLRYVFGVNRERGLLLRLAPKGLVIWALLGLVGAVTNALSFSQMEKVWVPAYFVPWAIKAISHALVLISLALVLRKALPIVEESRSLV